MDNQHATDPIYKTMTTLDFVQIFVSEVTDFFQVFLKANV